MWSLEVGKVVAFYFYLFPLISTTESRNWKFKVSCSQTLVSLVSFFLNSFDWDLSWWLTETHFTSISILLLLPLRPMFLPFPNPSHQEFPEISFFTSFVLPLPSESNTQNPFSFHNITSSSCSHLDRTQQIRVFICCFSPNLAPPSPWNPSSVYWDCLHWTQASTTHRNSNCAPRTNESACSSERCQRLLEDVDYFHLISS